MARFETTISLKQAIDTEKKGFVLFQAPQYITKSKVIDIGSDYNIDKVIDLIEQHLKKEFPRG